MSVASKIESPICESTLKLQLQFSRNRKIAFAWLFDRCCTFVWVFKSRLAHAWVFGLLEHLREFSNLCYTCVFEGPRTFRMEKWSLSDFVGKKTCFRSEKILKLCLRAQNNRMRGLASAARFKGHYFLFWCCSRGRQRRPGEGGKRGPRLLSRALCSGCPPATFSPTTLLLPRAREFCISLVRYFKDAVVCLWTHLADFSTQSPLGDVDVKY